MCNLYSCGKGKFVNLWRKKIILNNIKFFNTATNELSITYKQILISKIKENWGEWKPLKQQTLFSNYSSSCHINFFITLILSSSDPAVQVDSTAVFALPRWHIMSSKQNIDRACGSIIISGSEKFILKLRFCKEKLLCIPYSPYQLFLPIPFNIMVFDLKMSWKSKAFIVSWRKK